MASFSIQELLGLGKDGRANSTEMSKDVISDTEQAAAARNSGDGANSKHPTAPQTAEAKPEAEDAHDIDVETLDEDSNAELVTVEVQRTVHTTSSVSRTSATSRKRKRSKQAEDSPAKSDAGKPQNLIMVS